MLNSNKLSLFKSLLRNSTVLSGLCFAGTAVPIAVNITPAFADNCSNGGSGNSWACSGLITSQQSLVASGGNLTVNLSGVVSTVPNFPSSTVMYVDGNGFDVNYSGGNGGEFRITNATQPTIMFAKTLASGNIDLVNNTNMYLGNIDNNFSTFISLYNDDSDAATGYRNITNNGSMDSSQLQGNNSGILVNSKYSPILVTNNGAINLSGSDITTSDPQAFVSNAGISTATNYGSNIINTQNITRACHQLSQIIDATSWIAARKLHAVLS